MTKSEYLAHASKVLAALERCVASVTTFEARLGWHHQWRLMLFYFLLRAKQNLEAIALLCEAGYSIQAMMIARSTFELSITTEFISREKERRTTLFASYDWVERNRWLKKAQDAKDAWSEILAGGDPKVLEEIRKEYEAVKDEFPDPYKWAGDSMSLAKMCEELNAKHAYQFQYGLLCQITHNSVRCVSDHVEVDKDGVRVQAGPNPKYLEAAFATACANSIHIASYFSDEFGLKLESELKELLEGLR